MAVVVARAGIILPAVVVQVAFRTSALRLKPRRNASHLPAMTLH